MIFMNVEMEPIYLYGKITNYAITKDGRVFNTKYKRELKRKIDSKGYYVVTLSLDGVAIDQRVHRLVAMTYIENPNNYPIVNHLDGNKLNPYYKNLEWTTYKGNAQHASKHGLLKPAKLEDSGKAILTNSQVESICKIMESGTKNQYEIADMFNVDVSVIREIRLGNNWVDISKKYDIKNCKLVIPPPISNEKVISICELLVENKLSLLEISRKEHVSPYIVRTILNGKHHKDISCKYNFDNYNKKHRYSSLVKEKVRDLMEQGFSNQEIVQQLNMEHSPRTNTFMCRERKRYNEKMETVGSN